MLLTPISCHSCAALLPGMSSKGKRVECIGCGYATYCNEECMQDHADTHSEECALIKPLWQILTLIAGKNDEGKRPRSDGEGEEGSSPSKDDEGQLKRPKDKEEEEDTSSGSQRPRPHGPPPIVNVPLIMSGQPSAAIGRDIIRMLFQYFELDAATMMGVTRLWQQVAGQIDWKATVLARLDKRREGVDYTLAEWIYVYDIFALFPNLVPFAMVESDMTTTLPELIGLIQNPDDKLRLMSVLMLYYMYEEDQLTIKQTAAEETVRRDAVGGKWHIQWDYDVFLFDLVRPMGHGNPLVIGWAAGRTPMDLFFPAPLLTKEIPGTAPVGGLQSNLNLVQLSERWGPDATRNPLVRLPGGHGGVGGGARVYSVTLSHIKNLPKVLLGARYIFDWIFTCEDCPQWSEASMHVMSELDNLKDIRIHCPRWTTCSLECLKILGLQEFKVKCDSLESLTVPPSLIKPPLTPFLYGDPSQNVLGIRLLSVSRLRTLVIEKDPEPVEELTKRKRGDPYPYSKRIVPPFLEGEELMHHVTRLLVNAGGGSNLVILALRRNAYAVGMPMQKEVRPPGDSELYLVVTELYEWLDSGKSAGWTAERLFIETVEQRSGLFSSRTSLAEWFRHGLNGMESHARVLCQMAAERRRGVGAVISLEEMAEIVDEWRFANKVAIENPGYYDLVRERVEEIKNGRVSRMQHVRAIHNRVPIEVAWEIIQWCKAQTPIHADLRLEFVGVQTLPVWLWLCAPNLKHIEVASIGLKFRLPDQLMYHSGLRAFNLLCAGWDTANGCPQWNLFDLHPSALVDQPDTSRPRRMHDFQYLYILVSTPRENDGSLSKRVGIEVMPPLNLKRYAKFFFSIRPDGEA